MLSRRLPKWIKQVTAQVGSAHPSGWNVTLYLQFKRSFSFFFLFTQSAKFPSKVFWELIRLKRVNKMVNESSKRQSALTPRERTSTATPATFNITWICLNLLLRPLMEAAWPENHHSIYMPLSQRRRFFFSVDINYGWPRKSVTNTNIGTFFLDFHYHSTHIKIPKINSFLSILQRIFSSQFHRHSYIHQPNCSNLLFLVC